jgi:RNA polymerase sigma-70 factor (ECF subfamily)
LNSNAEALSKQPNFEEIYKRFRPGLIHFACTITRNMADAEEVVNDVFMAIWERHSKLLEQESIKSYLFRAVKNRSLNQINRNKVIFDDIKEEMPIASKDHNVLDHMQAKETGAKITELIDKLPTKCRQVFLFSRMHELSHKEIAELMDITPKTVENQIGLALKFLKENF